MMNSRAPCANYYLVEGSARREERDAGMTMQNIMIGFFFGFALGAGSSLAVMYSIYRGGYRRAVADSLLEPRPAEYERALHKARCRTDTRGLLG